MPLIFGILRVHEGIRCLLNFPLKRNFTTISRLVIFGSPVLCFNLYLETGLNYQKKFPRRTIEKFIIDKIDDNETSNLKLHH